MNNATTFQLFTRELIHHLFCYPIIRRINDWVSTLWKNCVRLFMTFMEEKAPKDESQIGETIFVYDVAYENSLFAAAVVKQYGKFRVVDYNTVASLRVVPSTLLVWIGFQPVLPVLLTLCCRHIALMGNKTDTTPISPLIKVYSGDYETLTSQIVFTVLWKLLKTQWGKEQMKLCIGAAYLIDLFEYKNLYADQNTRRLVTVGDDVNMDRMTFWFGPFHYETSKAWSLITMTYRYIHFCESWTLESIMDDSDPSAAMTYSEALSETRYLLEKHSQQRHAVYDGRVVVIHNVNVIDHHWYLIKRFIRSMDQIWETTRVFGMVIYTDTNVVRSKNQGLMKKKLEIKINERPSVLWWLWIIPAACSVLYYELREFVMAGNLQWRRIKPDYDDLTY